MNASRKGKKNTFDKKIVIFNTRVFQSAIVCTRYFVYCNLHLLLMQILHLQNYSILLFILLVTYMELLKYCVDVSLEKILSP